MHLSIIIPLFNESESLPELCSWIHRVVESQHLNYEIWLIDDGSTDDSWHVIQNLKDQYPHIKALRFRRNYGKSAALQTAFERVQGKVVITMDADLQDSPDEIPALYSKIAQDGYDLVSGWKQNRKDSLFLKNIPSKFYNRITGWISGIKLHDMNCGLKAYSNDVVKSIEVYGEMHRFIPVMVKAAGFKKITEQPVSHQARKYGVSKFGWNRFVNGFLDLLTICFMTRFAKRPMHLFGVYGSLMFVAGFALTLYLGAFKLYCSWNHIIARKLTDRPSFYIALTTILLGTFFFLAGFIGELIQRNSPLRNTYAIAEELK
ncbi:MAG: glycosyltransferase family 2 protein [Bacteroidota bacterium]